MRISQRFGGGGGARRRGGKPWALVAALGIVAVAGVESYALSQGIDGTALTAALACIAGLGGAGIGRLLR